MFHTEKVRSKCLSLTNVNHEMVLPVFRPDLSSENNRKLETLDVMQCLKIYLSQTDSLKWTICCGHVGSQKGLEGIKIFQSQVNKKIICIC